VAAKVQRNFTSSNPLERELCMASVSVGVILIRFIALIFMATSLYACAYADPKKVSPESNEVHRHQNTTRYVNASLGKIEVTGAYVDSKEPSNASSDIVGLLKSKLSGTNLFSAIGESKGEEKAKDYLYIDLKVNNQLVEARRPIDVLWYLLTLTLSPIGVDVVSDFDMRIRMPSGTVENFKEQCSSTAFHSGFRYKTSAKYAISENAKYCITSLVNRLVSEYSKIEFIDAALANKDQAQSSPSLSITNSDELMEKSKKQCTDLGFKEKTPKHGDCVLQLMKK
jgi:hypothetical protein